MVRDIVDLYHASRGVRHPRVEHHLDRDSKVCSAALEPCEDQRYGRNRFSRADVGQVVDMAHVEGRGQGVHRDQVDILFGVDTDDAGS